ncbi:MAG: 30S ribosomal protein S4 [Planctomycetia bacterium]|nr:30S ribosomal protein S4 [Planctomycetia bacterium]
MAHYNGPKARINRRLGAQIYENTGVLKATGKRNTPPGMARARGRKSVYGESLAEKQKIKYYYGISERQLRKLYSTSKRQKGNTGDNLKVLCERRLDNVIRRAGLCRTRPQARQGIAHHHFLVNGRPTDVASFMVRPGDVISVRKNEKLQEMYKLIWAEIGTPSDLGWMTVNGEELSITVTSLPLPEDFTAPVDKIGLVIEFLAR